MKHFLILATMFCFTAETLSVKRPVNHHHAHKPIFKTLKSAASFPIGVSVDLPALTNDTMYSNLVINEFNSITTENQLKWSRVSPAPGVFNFNGGDAIVNFALKHGMRIHGHALIYFEALPVWVQNFKGDSVAWENLFKTHIQTIVRHYKGKITSWDVCNELIDYNGNPAIDDGHKKSINLWLQHLGKDYIARAFIYAHQADPDALLFYNDSRQESYPKKLQAIVNMANSLKANNIPIGGLGLQMHIDTKITPEEIRNALIQVTKTGLKVHISELDIRLNPDDNIDSSTLQAASNQQSFLFNYIAHAYKTIVPKKQQYGITFWDVSDNTSWIKLTLHQQDSPLLFDDHYKKKPNYESFIKGLID